jgi:hypothetical protein
MQRAELAMSVARCKSTDAGPGAFEVSLEHESSALFERAPHENRIRTVIWYEISTSVNYRSSFWVICRERLGVLADEPIGCELALPIWTDRY